MQRRDGSLVLYYQIDGSHKFPECKRVSCQRQGCKKTVKLQLGQRTVLDAPPLPNVVSWQTRN